MKTDGIECTNNQCVMHDELMEQSCCWYQSNIKKCQKFREGLSPEHEAVIETLKELYKWNRDNVHWIEQRFLRFAIRRLAKNWRNRKKC